MCARRSPRPKRRIASLVKQNVEGGVIKSNAKAVKGKEPRTQ